MSTKTSIKRIALVAAAALTIGGFSAVSASAAANTYIGGAQGDGVSSYSLSNTTLGGVAGPANFVKIGFAATSVGVATISGGTFGSSADIHVVLNTAGTSASADGSQASGALVTIPTPTVGTITVNYYKQVSAGVYASTVTESVVITVGTASASGVYSAAKSSVYIKAGLATTATALTADDATTVNKSSLVPSNFDSTSVAATIQVAYLDGLGAAISTANDTVTATISTGPGVIGGNADSTTTSANAANATTYTKSIVTNTAGNTSGIYSFYVYANGQVGTSVVTIKNAAGTVLGTKSLVFAGTTVASIKVAVKKAYVLNSNTQTDKVFALNTYDSAGNEITTTTAPFTVSVATGSTVGAVATCANYDSTDAVYYCGAKASTSQAALTTDASETYTFTVGSVTASASVKFVSGVLTTVSIAGPASADPGTKVTYTLTALGANGAPLPDGAYAPGSIFTNADPSTNASLTVIPFGKGETITLAGGTATDYTYAPFSGVLTSTWTLLGTAGGSAIVVTPTTTSNFTAAGIAKALVGTTVTADDVAVSANTDATAAANAATDAANAAADAADQATAAVTELQTQVVALIAAIQKQITALTVLITKIKNKVKA
jgi:hypothetical protein